MVCFMYLSDIRLSHKVGWWCMCINRCTPINLTDDYSYRFRFNSKGVYITSGGD